MGKRGPAREPTTKLKQRGSWRADDRNDDAIPIHGEPVPPGWFEGVALEQWYWLVEQLRGMELLSKTDRNAMIQYCEAWELYMHTIEKIKDEGVTVIGGAGGVIVNPTVRVRNDTWQQLYRMSQQFGLTPSSRSGLKPNTTTKAKDGKAKFFNDAG